MDTILENQVMLAVGVLSLLSGGLAVILLIAEFFFANYGECTIDVNDGERQMTVKGGQNLLATLTEQKLYLPSACGGRGSCGMCKCRVLDGGGPVLPTEEPYLDEQERQDQTRLACQVKVKQDLKLVVPAELLSVKQYTCTVERIEPLTYDIRGVRFALPPGESVSFRAGQYMQLTAPPYGDVKESVYRAYSIASAPSDTQAVELVIRLVPDGIVTTYVFNHLEEGMSATLTGPYGDFYLRETDAPIVFIAGGSGLAPIQSIVLDMVEKGITHRKATFFFGARTTKDLYYVETFKALADEHEWFTFLPALSDPETEDAGYETGLITDVVARHTPDATEYEAYLCGSPGMIDACVNVLTANGMPEEKIYYDKFS